MVWTFGVGDTSPFGRLTICSLHHGTFVDKDHFKGACSLLNAHVLCFSYECAVYCWKIAQNPYMKKKENGSFTKIIIREFGIPKMNVLFCILYFFFFKEKSIKNCIQFTLSEEYLRNGTRTWPLNFLIFLLIFLQCAEGCVNSHPFFITRCESLH